MATRDAHNSAEFVTDTELRAQTEFKCPKIPYAQELFLNRLILLSLLFIGTSALVSAAPGDVDLSFNVGQFTHPTEAPGIRAIAVQPDGKILVAGIFTAVGGSGRIFVARLNNDSSLDTSFLTPLQTFGNSAGMVLALALQADGKILLGGGFYINNDYASVVRLNPDGSLDTTFSVVVTNTTVGTIVIQPDGKIIIAGNFGSIVQGPTALITPGIARLNSNGSIDTALGAVAGTSINIDAVALQPDGKIVIGGGFLITGSTRARLTRLNSNGTQDATFNVGNGADADVFALAVQPNNQILVGGSFTNINGVARVAFARINADGSVDSAFAPTLFAGSLIRSIIRQSNGKILSIGNFGVINGTVRVRIARLNDDGTLDAFYPTGLPSGFNNTLYTMALEAHGRVLIGGDFNSVAGIPRSQLARLLDTPPRTIADFDGDGCADLSVFRPSDRVWYISRSRDGFLGAQWGLVSDVLTPADYDGDGKADIAVWRPAPPTQAAFYILNSSSFTLRIELFGQMGDIPVAGDFDGDGKTDVAVFRNGAQSFFFYRASLNNPTGITTFLPWGTTADVPVAGDYDGDGRTDAAVFRPSNGTWYVRQSSDLSQRIATFGLNSDRLVPGDYDGDGRTDIAVFRAGVWYVFFSGSSTVGATAWGVASDQLVPADYDGDNKTDFAIYRNGVWWILRSASSSVSMRSFGLGSDVPVPSVYVR